MPQHPCMDSTHTALPPYLILLLARCSGKHLCVPVCWLPSIALIVLILFLLIVILGVIVIVLCYKVLNGASSVRAILVCPAVAVAGPEQMQPKGMTSDLPSAAA